MAVQWASKWVQKKSEQKFSVARVDALAKSSEQRSGMLMELMRLGSTKENETVATLDLT